LSGLSIYGRMHISQAIILLYSLPQLVVARICVNLAIPLTLSARLASFDLKVPKTPADIIALSLLLTNPSLNVTETLLTGYYTSSPKAYNISATLCRPETVDNGVLQILTHGIGFDKSYWDLPPPFANYSYVATVVDAGYSTLAIDRLGVGGSSRGDPINEIQAALHVEALASITQLIRNGTFWSQCVSYSSLTSTSISQRNGWGPPFGINGDHFPAKAIPSSPSTASPPWHSWGGESSDPPLWTKIIHVGHSFGSALTLSLTAKYPSLSDGIILTGFTLTSAYLPLFVAGASFQAAHSNQPFRLGSTFDIAAVSPVIARTNASDELQEEYNLLSLLMKSDSGLPNAYPDGYLVSATFQGLIYLFLLPGFFNSLLAGWAERHKQPVTPGELLTLGPLISEAPSTFTGPVLLFTGSADLPFCAGACGLGTGNLVAQGIDAMWPRAKVVNAYVQPNTGHGLTMHWNATAGYAVINEWLKGQGIG
jgi:pimeloyl-ACP methyl ester carboxylesterase